MLHDQITNDQTQRDLLLYAFGSNGSGQLGLGHRDDVRTPFIAAGSSVFSGPGITDLASGGNHTVILCKNGTLASTGENEDGRCPSNVPRNADAFTFSLWSLDAADASNSKVTHIAATWTATIFQVANGLLYSSGTGDFGELGLGTEVTHMQSPTLIPAFPPEGTRVVKLASCMGHVVAVLSNGDVWGWGTGRKGQLGEPAETVWTPRKITGIQFFAVDAVCGKDFTFVAGTPDAGVSLMLGNGRGDRYGVRKNAPKHISNWKQISASWGSIFVLKEDGELVAWGRNDHGQLPSSDLPLLKAIAAGSEHCLGMTTSGTVLAWGWGEHGNCSDPVDDAGDVKQMWNQIKTAHCAEQIFAGCATSFVVTHR